MFTLSVKGNFAAAHFLSGYAGPCAAMHGHTWTVEIVCRAEETDRLGIAADFSLLKRELKKVLLRFDHTTINGLLQETVEDMKNNPTAENIARYIYDVLKPVLPIALQSVIVWESPNAWAAYSESE